MARIALATFGSYGDITPYIALAIALRNRGHSVVVATSEVYRERVEQASLPFHSVRPDLTAQHNLQAVALTGNADRDVEAMLRNLLFPHLRDSYEDLYSAVRDADLLVTHILAFAAPLVAAKTGIPWVSCVLSPRVFLSEYEPSAVIPLKGGTRLTHLSAEQNRNLLHFVKRSTSQWAEPIHKLRSELGLPAGGNPVFEQPHSQELVLALFSRLLAVPQPDWPPRTRITGFPKPARAAMDPELAHFLESGPPPIVFTLGSDSDYYAGSFFVESVNAARMLGHRAVLAGPSLVRCRVGDVFATDYAPYSELFHRAAAVVHHAGVGTSALALRAGRPMLAVPNGHDQPDTAARLERLGVARVVVRHAYSANIAASELQILLSEPRYAMESAQLGSQVQDEDGISVACDLIEERLDETGPMPGSAFASGWSALEL